MSEAVGAVGAGSFVAVCLQTQVSVDRKGPPDAANRREGLTLIFCCKLSESNNAASSRSS
jgi:hypothetical protein